VSNIDPGGHGPKKINPIAARAATQAILNSGRVVEEWQNRPRLLEKKFLGHFPMYSPKSREMDMDLSPEGNLSYPYGTCVHATIFEAIEHHTPKIPKDEVVRELRSASEVIYDDPKLNGLESAPLDEEMINRYWGKECGDYRPPGFYNYIEPDSIICSQTNCTYIRTDATNGQQYCCQTGSTFHAIYVNERGWITNYELYYNPIDEGKPSSMLTMVDIGDPRNISFSFFDAEGRFGESVPIELYFHFK
jgi:hypothetical protein